MRDCIVSVTQKSKMCLLFCHGCICDADKSGKQEFRKGRKVLDMLFCAVFVVLLLFVLFCLLALHAISVQKTLGPFIATRRFSLSQYSSLL